MITGTIKCTTVEEVKALDKLGVPMACTPIVEVTIVAYAGFTTVKRHSNDHVSGGRLRVRQLRVRRGVLQVLARIDDVDSQEWVVPNGNWQLIIDRNEP
jgi:hypothetical protein